MRKAIIAIIILLTPAAAFTENQTSKLTVQISAIRNNQGDLYVALHNTKDTFLKNDKKPFSGKIVKAENNKSFVVFENIPYGEYAVAVWHDENSNKKMDMKLGIIPTEGFGASNNPKTKMGPPNYDECKFMINSADKAIKINMIYL